MSFIRGLSNLVRSLQKSNRIICLTDCIGGSGGEGEGGGEGRRNQLETQRRLRRSLDFRCLTYTDVSRLSGR